MIFVKNVFSGDSIFQMVDYCTKNRFFMLINLIFTLFGEKNFLHFDKSVLYLFTNFGDLTPSAAKMRARGIFSKVVTSSLFAQLFLW